MKIEIILNDQVCSEDPDIPRIWAEAFQKMMDRMAVSHFKYGGPTIGIKDNAGDRMVDEMKCARQRLAMYSQNGLTSEGLCTCEDTPHSVNCFLKTKKLGTGNTENLLDAANFLLIEYGFPQHNKAHFKSQTSAQSPGLVYYE